MRDATGGSDEVIISFVSLKTKEGECVGRRGKTPLRAARAIEIHGLCLREAAAWLEGTWKGSQLHAHELHELVQGVDMITNHTGWSS